ncbi:MAG: SH3 domain-containing protein [Desulfomonilaceae bacterium]|nr:SH3 domain-containing protein [Desulfomonilaceae bacterium]
MRKAFYRGLFIATVVTACVVWSLGAEAANVQYEAVGPIAGTVAAPDSARGAVVRAGPSQSDRALGVLRNGTRVKNYLEFANGWVRIRTPFHGAWVQASYIVPQSAPAVVTGVDQPENCLRVREGPGSEFEVVGCLAHGETLTLTGLWSENNWAEISHPVSGWVHAAQIGTGLDPSYPTRTSPVREVVVESYPTLYPEDLIVDPYFYDYNYAYPLGAYIYGAYPWYYIGKRFHKRFYTNRFHGKDYWRYGKPRHWDRRAWRVNRDRRPVIGAGTRGGSLRVGSRRGGSALGVDRRAMTSAVRGSNRGFRYGGGRGSAINLGAASRGGSFRMGGSRGRSAAFGSAPRGGSFRMGGSRGGSFRIGGGRVGGMSLGGASRGGGFRIGGGGSRGGFSGRIGGGRGGMGGFSRGGGGRGGFRR